ncbi:unnamed protein product [Prorocentrum cordatum]|uniref:Uncharacterized protein n=1 Tax=Prorocentrum cordatum TaxID=2364126 RepID=A0ABN9TDE9_9DINO|nr:unnamed protein product [Polarella glacialis]
MALAAARRLRRRERRRPREDLGSRPARARHRGHCRTVAAGGSAPVDVPPWASSTASSSSSLLLAPPPGTSRSTAPARAELPPVGCKRRAVRAECHIKEKRWSN